MKKVLKNKSVDRRERAAFAFRIDPMLADWYAASALKRGRSRNHFMEMVLHSIRRLAIESEKWEREGLNPDGAMEVLGSVMLNELVDLGLASDFMKDVLNRHQARQRELLIEIQNEKAIRRAVEGE